MHALFDAGLAAKGVFAGIEVLAGSGLLLAPPGQLATVVAWLSERELIEAASGPLAARFLQPAQAVSPGSQHFYALYLLSHGAAKLVMVAMLALRIQAAYPLSLVAMAAFIAYQLRRWTVTHGPMLLVLTVLDLVVMWLIWHEWRSAGRSDLARR